MNMPNNPLIVALQMARGGQNPMQMLQKSAMQNPPLAQAMKIIEGKSPQQLQTIAENMAKQRGIDLNQLMQSLGINQQKK